MQFSTAGLDCPNRHGIAAKANRDLRPNHKARRVQQCRSSREKTKSSAAVSKPPARKSPPAKKQKKPKKQSKRITTRSRSRAASKSPDPKPVAAQGQDRSVFHQSPLSRDYRRCNPSLLIRSHRLRRNWLQRSSNRRLNRRGLGASHKKNNLLNILKVGPSMRRTRKRLVKLTVQSRRKKSFRRHLSLGLLVTKPAMKLLPLP